MSEDANSASPATERITFELLERIRDGDTDAWNDLYRRYHDELLFAVRCRLGQKLRRHLESEDILQSMMLEALDDLQKFEPRGENSLKHFLNVLITNKIRDRADTFSAQKRSGAVPLTDTLLATVPGMSGVPQYLEGERYERLERGLDQLPEEMREVILLRKVEGLASKEVAELLGKSDTSVRKLYSRAMARLSTMVNP